MSGYYRVGNNEAIKTLNEVVDRLYSYGVSGECVFELTDAVYNERSWTEDRWNLPALDFRGKIPGVYETITYPGSDPILRTNQIRFVPSSQRSTSRASVQINLESLTGVGI